MNSTLLSPSGDFTGTEPQTIIFSSQKTIFSISYDHAGQRALRTHDVVGDELDPSVTYYAGTYEEDDSGDARLFLDAPGRRLAQVTIPKSQPPAVQYLHPDALGSSPLGTGQSGDLASAVDQEPYGLRRFDKLNGDLPLPARSYTGKELDPSSWYYFGARYYDPTSARFTQIDPLTLQLQGQRNLQGILADPWRYLHPYAYAANNPVKYTDPDGNFIPFLIMGAYLAWQAYDAYATARDVHTAFTDPNATGLDKGMAVAFAALTFSPVDDVADAVKYGGKAVRAIDRAIDASTALRPVRSADGLRPFKNLNWHFSRHRADFRAAGINVRGADELRKLGNEIADSTNGNYAYYLGFGKNGEKLNLLKVDKDRNIGVFVEPDGTIGSVFPFKSGNTVGNRLDPTNPDASYGVIAPNYLETYKQSYGVR